MAKVYFSKNLDSNFLSKLKQELKETFKGCKKIAIKIHFGEPGNKTAFSPEQIKPVTDILKELNIAYFLYDSSVAYKSLRGSPETHKKVALEKGWGELGEIKTDDSFIIYKGKINYEVCKPLADADGVLVISHFKGHDCAGFGGAIKNLGMGALSKETKGRIHGGGTPQLIGTCLMCKECEKACPMDFIKVTDKPEYRDCYGCSNCIYACKHNVLKPKVDYFDFLLAEGAKAALSCFKKSYFVSYIVNISKLCDCASNPGGVIAGDCGYVASKDIVAIDNASRDIVVKSEGEDVFLKQNKKSGIQQINAAEKLGMGSSKYSLIQL